MRIVQVTDLHLRHFQPGSAAIPRRRSREMKKLFPQALAEIAQGNPDLLVVTGDLLDAPAWLYQPVPGFSGDDESYWESAIEKDYQLLKRMLDETGLRYVVLPGNHDYEAIFWKVFDPEPSAFEHRGFQIIRFCDHEHTGNYPRRFYPQRELFEQSLSYPDSKPQIHLQHYVLHPELNSGYPHSYKEAKSLVGAIVDSGKVRLSLSGHYHEGTDLHLVKGTYFSVGKAFCNHPFSWRVYEVHSKEVHMEEKQLASDSWERKPVVFLDRDGVINDLASYRFGPEKMQLIDGSARAIRRLQDAGYAIVVVTNQSCVGLGYVPEGVMHCVNDRMCRLIKMQSGADIDAIYASTGAGKAAVLPQYERTTLNKPNPTMLDSARRELNLKPGGWMVGDRLNDALTAKAAGAAPILVRTGLGKEEEASFKAEFPQSSIVDTLEQAADYILATHIRR